MRFPNIAYSNHRAQLFFSYIALKTSVNVSSWNVHTQNHTQFIGHNFIDTQWQLYMGLKNFLCRCQLEL